MLMADKDWDDYVVNAEELARSPGFRALRDEILDRARITPDESVLDCGAGTGLLTLSVAGVAGRVWALDISAAMCGYLGTKAASAGLENVEPVVGSVVSLPLVDESVDVVISNYCFHHVSNDEKERALNEIFRVLTPGGRLVFGDMMFSVSLATGRDRAVLRAKVRGMLAKGPAGVWRLARNAGRYVSGRWEQPADPGWWQRALVSAGFNGVEVVPLEHEGAIAVASKPDEDPSFAEPENKSGVV